MQNATSIEPTRQQLAQIHEIKYGAVGPTGWGPRLRRRFRYFTPEDYYEGLLMNVVQDGCHWADIGCGRSLLQSAPLARALVRRPAKLVGIDPDENIHDNHYVHEAFQGRLEDYSGPGGFDVITMKMVAEHVSDPKGFVRTLGRLVKPGGMVVVYTPDRYSLSALAAAVTPMSIHHAVKRFLWGTEERDTFPVHYRMNSRKQLARVFGDNGFREACYLSLADCRATNNFRLLNTVELSAIKAAELVGLKYPETCIVAVYVHEGTGELREVA